ncbi:MAG: hypothetical protein FJ102_11775, partial [Deltaproteobacteria bacterium]|nr:hypothetical protein [Deltaproteobacteria bacterium]
MHVHLLDLNAGLPNRGTAAIVGLVRERGHPVSVYDVRARGELPPAGDGAWILGGGPGSPLEPGAWREPLLAALRARTASSLPTLAICYGCEMLGAALGADLRRLREERDGVYALRLLAASGRDLLMHGLDPAAAYEKRSWGVFDVPAPVLAAGPDGDAAAFR